MNPLLVEWVGGWMDLATMGPWPSASDPAPVYVMLVGPLYVSFHPSMLLEGLFS